MDKNYVKIRKLRMKKEEKTKSFRLSNNNCEGAFGRLTAFLPTLRKDKITIGDWFTRLLKTSPHILLRHFWGVCDICNP